MSKFQVAKTAALKLALAFAAIAGAVQLIRLVVLPGIEMVFHPGESMTSTIRRIGILSFAVLAYWGYVRFYEKRPATELRVAPLGIVVGAVSGALLISITTLSLFALGAYEMTAYRGPQSALLGVAGFIAVAAILEELVYRLVLFRILEEACGTTAAMWLQALIFAVGHLSNAPASNAELAMTLVAVTVLGAFWTCIYVYTRNLWVVAANHAAWNFAIILSGVPLSGLEDWRALAPIESQYNGPAWLTGGVFGPEDSIITMVVLAIGLAVLVNRSRKSNRFVVVRAPSPA